MADRDDVEQAYTVARERATKARYGVGAAFIGSVFGDRADDSWRGVVAVTDGTEDHQMLVCVSETVPLGAGSAKGELIAALIEEMAGDYADGERLEGLRQQGSRDTGLRIDQRFPDLWRAAFDGA
jgi:hypothetical protein